MLLELLFSESTFQNSVSPRVPRLLLMLLLFFFFCFFFGGGGGEAIWSTWSYRANAVYSGLTMILAVPMHVFLFLASFVLFYP